MSPNEYSVVYLVLKRLRSPLIILILSYAVSTAGMALIPGIDNDGNPVNLTILQAFYFISYVATTIGFGEVPYEFTDVQRLWVVFCIHLTVIAWLVAIKNIIFLLRDPALQNVLKKQRFSKQVAGINQKFFIICGYGETGALLLESLLEQGYQCVVIDNDQERIDLLDLNSSIFGVPFILDDAGDVEVLRMAGLENDHCRAVLAVTNNDKVNVKIAVAAKLLKSSVKVICRVNSKEATANAKSFDTDHVLNPNRLYAESIGRAFRTPSIHQLSMSLLRRSGRAFAERVIPPKGHWIVCGDNPFGQEMVRFLEYEGMDYTVIGEARPTGEDYIHGTGTEAVTLRAAGIEKSVGLVAGTGDDTNNFSILMTARHLKPNLYLAARQNLEANGLIFQNADVDSLMEASRLMKWHVLPLITKPCLAQFLRLAGHQDETWGEHVITQLKAVSDTVPSTYLMKIRPEKAPAVIHYLETGNILRLQDIYAGFSQSDDASEKSVALPLMLIRDGKEELLPEMSTAIKVGDVYLMASTEAVQHYIEQVIKNEQAFFYCIHGKEKPVSIVMHHIRKRLQHYKDYRHKQRLAKRKRQVTPPVSPPPTGD